jgi:hypothetical protein
LVPTGSEVLRGSSGFQSGLHFHVNMNMNTNTVLLQMILQGTTNEDGTQMLRLELTDLRYAKLRAATFID